MLFGKKKLKKATDEDEAQFAKVMEENAVDKKDTFAMIASAFLVIVLPCLLLLLGLSALMMLIFGAFG